tara:strand:- start:171 stop:893 length:723 start_codon:yes stop_codon:yes gene_type:complete
MKITKQRLQQIIKEEIIKAENRVDTPIEEGWKDAAIAAAMGLSSLGAPTPAQAAPPSTTSQVATAQAEPSAAAYGITSTQAAASVKTLPELANKMEKYIGPRSTHWLHEGAWDSTGLQEDTLVAWDEVYAAVDTFWTETLPNQRAGCEQNAEMQICRILKQIEDKFDDEVGPIKEAVARQQDKDPTKASRALVKKMNKFLDRWVPDTKNETDFQRTDGWTENAQGFDPSGPGTLPDDDDL